MTTATKTTTTPAISQPIFVHAYACIRGSAEYRRRYFNAGLGVQENERLKQRIVELEEKVRTLSARGIDCGTFVAGEL